MVEFRVDASSVLILVGLGVAWYIWRENKPIKSLEKAVSRYNPATYLKEYTQTMPRFYQFESERLI